MSEPTRRLQLDQIHTQLKDWQENLARRVAGEAQALDVEVDKLHDRELEEAWQRLRGAHAQILAGCDTIRDLRRRLQDRQPSP
jgi:hypothetical protein